jgi:hypothetical protein
MTRRTLHFYWTFQKERIQKTRIQKKKERFH